MQSYASNFNTIQWSSLVEEATSVYDETIRLYLDEIFSEDYASRLPILGVQSNGNEIIIPFFKEHYRMSAEKIIGPTGEQPSHSISVVLCKYLLLCPDEPPVESDWISYRDIRDAAPFAGSFANHVEKAIAKHFAGRLTELRGSCLKLGGYSPDIRLSYDLIMQFDALPRVPILLLFNDVDSEFPAQSSALFERRASRYLDVESLAISGWHLSGRLQEGSGNTKELPTPS